MTPFTKNSLHIFIVSLVMANLTTNAMEAIQPTTNTIATKYPQLKLQNQSKQNEITHIDCSIAIFFAPRSRSIAYASQQDHDNILNYHHVHSTIKDPIILLKITDNNGNNACVNLPIKKCLNLSSGSLLEIYEADGSSFSKNYKKNQPLLFNATCNTTFSKDFNDAINKFKTHPSVHINARNQTELENAGIIEINREIKSSYPNIKGTYTFYGSNYDYNPHWIRIFSGRNLMETFYVETVKDLVIHGPNGCPNEQALIQPMINEQFPKNKNLFKSLMNQQINGK